MSEGDHGAYITHSLHNEQSEINLRYMMSPQGLTGGRVVVLAGLDGQGKEVLRQTFDTVSNVLSVWLPGGIELSAPLAGAIAWQCIEVRIDTVAEYAGLWVNGVIADHYNGDLSTVTIKTIWFGAINKQTGVTGDLYLDELCIADAYVGPVVITPSQEYAGDPARWLIVYNTADPDAASWAEQYRAARHVPFANLLGLTLPTAETISASEYADLVGAIGDYLNENRLAGQVMGLLLGYRVPGYVDFTGSGPLEPVPALLHTDSVLSGSIPNTNTTQLPGQRLTAADLAGTRMTARLDAYNITAADQLLVRSSTMIQTCMNGDDSAIYFDPFVGSNPAYQQAFTSMLDWATGLRGMRTRLPIVLSGDPNGQGEASFTSVSGDGMFWGWSSSWPDPDIFLEPSGRRAVCTQMYLEGASATTLRNPVPSNWADTPIAAGYAAAITSSRSNEAAAIPDAGAFFDALRGGWTLGEAWHIAQPILRSGFYLVGDPLMTVGFPKQGYEIYGPLQNLEDMNPASPDYVLAADQTELDLSADLPEAGVVSHYVIRRTDPLGRAEASSTSACVINIDNSTHTPVSMPIWPDGIDWPLTLEDGLVGLIAWWGDPGGLKALADIEVLSQAEGQAVVVAAAPSWSPRDRHVLSVLPIPAVKTRYQWRFTSHEGVQRLTAFSDWVEPTSTPLQDLQPIGATA